MPITKAFKSGNSQAVRIPAEIAYADMTQDLQITRTGDVITIWPAKGDIKAAIEELRTLPRPSEIEVREPIEIPERE